MVVVVVRNDNRVDGRDVLDLTRDLCVALGPQPAEGTAPLTKNRIEQNP